MSSRTLGQKEQGQRGDKCKCEAAMTQNNLQTKRQFSSSETVTNIKACSIKLYAGTSKIHEEWTLKVNLEAGI